MPVNDTSSNAAVEELIERAAAKIEIKVPEPDPDRLRRVRRSGTVHEGMDAVEGMDWKDRPKGVGKRLKAAEERINAELNKNLRDAMAAAMVEGSYKIGDKTPKSRTGTWSGLNMRPTVDTRPPVESKEEIKNRENRRELFSLLEKSVPGEDYTRVMKLLEFLGLTPVSYEEQTESDENLFL